MQQAKSLWCWSAVANSILRYYGDTTTSQCGFVTNVKGTTGCADDSGSMNETGSGLYSYGVSSNSYTGALTWSQIKAQISGDSSINGDKPIVVGWMWSVGSVGHIVGIDGYYVDSNGNNIVEYMDPATGSHKILTYNNFNGGLGDRTWIEGRKDMWAYGV